MPSLDLSAWPLPWVVAAFAATAIVIAVAGTRLTAVADDLADLTGLGEAIFGAVLLGGTTSLAGITTSVAAAWQGYGDLAVSNALGGIAAQTSFLAIADMAHRGINLEHAAASVENLMQGALLVTLLAIPLLATSAPPATLWSIHPASLLLVLMYLFGIRLVRRAGAEALWTPRRTPETRVDEPDRDAVTSSLPRLWLRFAVLGLVVAAAGYLVARTGIAIADRTGLSETVVGAFLTAIATSLPELVTSVAAVRQGALTLAVGGVIGGNSFDVLFLAFSDVAFRGGSIYHTAASRHVFVIALTILLTGTLLLGLLRRERKGIGGIGFESFLVLILYGLGFLLLAFGGL